MSAITAMAVSKVTVGAVTIAVYVYQGVYHGIKHVVSPSSSLHEVQKKHCGKLVESTQKQGFDYRHGIMNGFHGILLLLLMI